MHTTTPKGWETKSLENLLDIQNGYAFASDRFSNDRGMPLIRIRDLKGGYGTVVRFDGEFDDNFVVKSGDLLIGMDGEFRCYKWQGPDALLNQRVCRLIDFSDELLPDFVLFGINPHLKVIEKNTPFVTVRHLSAKKIKSIDFSYPPLDEQRRIVARIKECMERVEELEGLRAEAMRERDYLLESLIEAEYQEAEGKNVMLTDICAITSKLVDPREQQYVDLIHIGGGNIEAKTSKLLELKTAREEKLKSSKFVFDNSMVLYNKIRPYLMKVARPDFSGLCSADMYPLLPDPEKLTRDYLFYLLLSRNFTDYAIAGSNRAGMPKVNRNHLFAYKFTLPSIEKQQRITETLDVAVSAVEELRADMTLSSSETNALRESILRKAFAGEL
ncbi:MAG: restriction endonuclease subunit S [Desulfocapsaceae bacterium]|nr:restriction endonuclease subunit S [Desulfocapsaceae bacterium]